MKIYCLFEWKAAEQECRGERGLPSSILLVYEAPLSLSFRAGAPNTTTKKLLLVVSTHSRTHARTHAPLATHGREKGCWWSHSAPGVWLDRGRRAGKGLGHRSVSLRSPKGEVARGERATFQDRQRGLRTDHLLHNTIVCVRV